MVASTVLGALEPSTPFQVQRWRLTIEDRNPDEVLKRNLLI